MYKFQVLNRTRRSHTPSHALGEIRAAIYKQQPPFGVEIHVCSDICPRPLSVPKSEQFSESVENVSFEEQIMSANKHIQAYVCAKWSLLCLISFKDFSQHAQF